MSLAGVRIACFVALPHHSRFLWPVMERARAAGAQTLFFTTLSDYPFERDVVRRGVPCRLLQEYADAALRRRVAETSRAFFREWAGRIFEWDGMQHWPLVLQDSLIRAGLEEVHCVEAFMRAERPDIVVALHERNRWGKLLGHAARRHGAAYVTFQEGDYYEDRISFASHSEYSTALLLWGERTRERLLRHRVAPEKIVLTGNTHLGEAVRELCTPEVRAETRRELGIAEDARVVLFLVGLQWGVAKSRELWGRLLAGFGEELVPLFKWHPKVAAHSFESDYVPMIRELLPRAVLVHNFDAYPLLAAADACVALGKTTMAAEALGFGRPLFSTAGLDGEPDHCAREGISQPVGLDHGWEALHRTLAEGVPEAVRARADAYLDHYFFRRNREAVARAVAVLETVAAARGPRPRALPLEGAGVPGRVSFVLPSEADPRALLATLVSLAQRVELPDWEVVIVRTAPGADEALRAVGGDLRVVEGAEGPLGAQWNRGAEAATGERLVFLRPGIVWYRTGSLAAARGPAAPVVRAAEGGREWRGLAFDFNGVPRPAADGQAALPGGGVLALERALLAELGGFDPGLDGVLAEADLALAAREAGAEGSVCGDALAVAATDPFALDDGPEAWRRLIPFFARWQGRAPKAEDFAAHAGELMRA